MIRRERFVFFRGFVESWITLRLSDVFREPVKNEIATILTPNVIRPRQRQWYSQSRRSSEFPCDAHARRFPVFPSRSLRDAGCGSYVSYVCALERQLTVAEPRRRWATPLLKRAAHEADAGPGLSPLFYTFHRLHCCDIRLFYISLIRWVSTYIHSRAIYARRGPVDGKSASRMRATWRGVAWRGGSVKWRVFSDRFVAIHLSRSIIVVRGYVSFSPACKWRSVCDFICHCPDATHNREEFGRSTRVRASAKRIDRPLLFRRELSTRRHFVPGPTSPTAILAFHVSDSRLTVSFPLFAGRERLASPQDGSSALVLSVPLFFSRSRISMRARYAIWKNCQFVFVSRACTHTRQRLM